MATLCLALLCLTLHGQSLWGRVVKITDGDTFTLLLKDNRLVKLRLHGIDAPEKGQPFGNNARQFLAGLVFGKTIRVDSLSRDRYRRIIGIAFTPEGQNVNEAMLAAGMAWHFVKYDKSPAWAALEINARRTRRGLWSDPAAVAPWLWRGRK